MRATRSALAPGMLSAWLMTSCIAPTIEPTWADAAAAHHGTAPDPSAGATPSRVLEGFDPPTDAGFAVGDEVLFRVALHRGEETQRAWLVRVVVNQVQVHDQAGNLVYQLVARRVMPERTEGDVILLYEARPATAAGETAEPAVASYESPIMALGVNIYDDDGNAVADTVVHVGRAFLRNGFIAACDVLSDPDPARDKRRDSSVRRAGTNALLTFLSIVKRDEHLREIFWEVVRLPTLWSMLTNFGVTVRVRPEFGEARGDTEKLGARTLPARRFPLQVTGNDQPMLLGSMRVVSPTSPLALCAGITSFVAVRPGDPETRITMRLLAARRSELANAAR